MKQYALFENGLIHTERLTKIEAEEMLNRYQRCYPDLNFHIQILHKNHEYGYA